MKSHAAYRRSEPREALRSGRAGRARRAPAIFLDRDGTLTPEIGHVGCARRIRLLEETPRALRLLRSAGYRLICVTNQSGLARGLYGRRSLERVLERLVRLLEEAGTPLDAVYVCPHHPDHGTRCRCRKPGTRMLEIAAREWNLDLGRSISIGDRWSDVACGQRAGGRGILIERAGAGGREILIGPAGAGERSAVRGRSRVERHGAGAGRGAGRGIRPDARAKDLLEAARLVARGKLSSSRRRGT